MQINRHEEEPPPLPSEMHAILGSTDSRAAGHSRSLDGRRGWSNSLWNDRLDLFVSPQSVAVLQISANLSQFSTRCDQSVRYRIAPGGTMTYQRAVRDRTPGLDFGDWRTTSAHAWSELRF